MLNLRHAMIKTSCDDIYISHMHIQSIEHINEPCNSIDSMSTPCYHEHNETCHVIHVFFIADAHLHSQLPIDVIHNVLQFPQLESTCFHLSFAFVIGPAVQILGVCLQCRVCYFITFEFLQPCTEEFRSDFTCWFSCYLR